MQNMDRRPHKILIADDHPDAADSAAELLRLCGFEVEAVLDGRQAVEAAREFQPDLVILDIDMPVMNGYEAAAALREEWPMDKRLVLVALTGRTQHADIERARLAGFDHHMAKPMIGNTLCALIASFLDESRSRSRLLMAPRNLWGY